MITKILNKCVENNLLFIGFKNDENKYVNNKTKLILKCNNCGYEWCTTSYDKFIRRKSLCPSCTNKKKLNLEEIEKRIIERCVELDYSFLNFVSNENIKKSSKLLLKCNKCGEIWGTTTINNFLKKDRKSHKCGRKNPKFTSHFYKDKNIVIKEIENKLKDSTLKFVDIEGEYKGVKNLSIRVKCTDCGKESIISYSNLGKKCKNCQFNGKINNDYALYRITEKCLKLNYTFIGFKNYENRYNGKKTKLILKCNNCGRIWSSTIYQKFVNSNIKCVGCINRWKLEEEIKILLDENNIVYEFQKTFKWLVNKSKLFLDFYLPEYNIFIECQGRQHFVPISNFGGIKGFEQQRERDKIKYYKCVEHGIKPLYFAEKKYKMFDDIIVTNDKNELLNIIKNG